MKLNELYNKQTQKSVFDSGDIVIDISTDHNDIGTVLSFDEKVKAYKVKFKNSDGTTVTALRGADEIRLATPEELKANAAK